MKIAIALCCLLLSVLPAHALDFKKTGAVSTTAAVNSAVVGVQLCATIDNACIVTVPTTAAVPVWVAQVAVGTACSTMVATSGVRITAGNGFSFLPREDGWIGQLCGLLESGVTAVTVTIDAW